VTQMSDLKKDFNRQLNEAQNKYTYFLLAVAASAIALAVQRTTNRSLDGSLILLGFAVLSWAASFGAGCRNRAFFMSTLYANVALQQLQDGSHPNCHSRPEIVDTACEEVRSAAHASSSSANLWGKLQFQLLVLGALFFLAWHIQEMATYEPGTVAPRAVTNTSLKEMTGRQSPTSPELGVRQTE